jgi:hypothetical protein
MQDEPAGGVDTASTSSSSQADTIEKSKREEAKPVLKPWSTNGMILKDWSAIVLSGCAFIVSFLSFYFSNVRQVDDLWLILGNQQPITMIVKDGASLDVSPTLAFTFINSGTRTAAVTNIAFLLRQPTDMSDRSCSYPRAPIEYETDVIVLQPGQIAAKTLSAKKKQGYDEVEEDFRGWVNKPTETLQRMWVNKPKEGDVIFVSYLHFSIVTPSLKKEVEFPISRVTYEIPPTMNGKSNLGDLLFKPNEAIRLYDEGAGFAQGDKTMRYLLIGGGLTGLIASLLWGWSALLSQPNFEMLGTFVVDETGIVPANRYLGNVSKLNAWAAGFTALSVLLVTFCGWLTS